VLKENGRSRKSKASKGRSKTRRIKCPECHEMVIYSEENITKIGNKIAYVTCSFCEKEIKLK